jgi:hypothetical protein
MEANWTSKIDRAREHLDSLADEERIFLAESPYHVETSREGNDVVVRVRDLAPIPSRLPLIVGDAIHNARSALDHLVMGLAERGQGSLGRAPTTESEERRLSFPVTESDAGFQKWVRDVEPYVSHSAIAVIKALQSSRLLEQFENDHRPLEKDEKEACHLLNPLVRLHRLDNIDKHRRLALSLWFPGAVEQGAAEPEFDDADQVSEPVTDPKILAMLDDAIRRESEDPTFADFFFLPGPIAEGSEVGRYMRADRGRVVDDTQVRASLRIVLVEPGITGRFPGAPPVQRAVTDLVDAAEGACAFVENHLAG